MDSAQFWKLIERSKKRSHGDLDEQAEILVELLEKLSAKDLVDFVRIVEELEKQAYSWDLWAAAYIINSGCSDDCFEYFRDWLIVQGEELFSKAITDPDSLAEVNLNVEEPNIEFEGLSWFALEAFKEKTGEDMQYPTSEDHTQEPKGVRWEEAEVGTRCPRLAAKFAG